MRDSNFKSKHHKSSAAERVHSALKASGGSFHQEMFFLQPPKKQRNAKPRQGRRGERDPLVAGQGQPDHQGKGHHPRRAGDGAAGLERGGLAAGGGIIVSGFSLLLGLMLFDERHAERENGREGEE